MNFLWSLQSSLFDYGYAIYFYEHAEEGGGDGRPCRRVVLEVLFVHLVELGEPREVGHVSVDLHDIVEARAGRLEDRSYVFESLAYLIRKGIWHGARLGVHGTLPRDEHKIVRNHSVGVRSGGSRPLLCHNGLSHRFSLLGRSSVTCLDLLVP